MKKLLILSIILFSQILFSQKSKIDILLNEGAIAFNNNDFVLAKDIFSRIISIDSINKDAIFNLGVSELQLGENEKACQNFYKLYLLKDIGVIELILEYCPDLKKGEIISSKIVDELPKFIFKGETYPIVENKSLNKTYQRILTEKLKDSRILGYNLKGNFSIQISVNKFNQFNGNIKFTNEEDNKEYIRQEIFSIVSNIVPYICAKENGKNIEIWEIIYLPIIYKN